MYCCIVNFGCLCFALLLLGLSVPDFVIYGLCYNMTDLAFIRLKQLACEMDGWMTSDFKSFSTVFQSYQDDVWMILKGCVQLNSIYN